jgi:uncharacterized membrane protein
MLTVVAEFWQDALPPSTGVVSQVSTTAPRRGAIVASVCLSVFAINSDVAAGASALGLAVVLALPGALPSTALVPAAPALEQHPR